jgi:hypothetical protein
VQIRNSVLKIPFCCFVLMLMPGVILLASQDGVRQGNPFPLNDNQWRLGYSTNSFESEGSYEEVAGHQMGDQSPNRPMEVNGVYENTTPNKVVLANPQVSCVNTGPAETNACTFTSSSAVQVDATHIKYTFRNWGGRCIMSLRVMSYKPTVVWRWSDPAPWSTGSPFIVVVPEEAVAGTSVVFGKLGGKNIYFTPSDPLSDVDAKYFKLLEPKKVVPGLGTVYRLEIN